MAKEPEYREDEQLPAEPLTAKPPPAPTVPVPVTEFEEFHQRFGEDANALDPQPLPPSEFPDLPVPDIGGLELPPGPQPTPMQDAAATVAQAKTLLKGMRQLDRPPSGPPRPPEAPGSDQPGLVNVPDEPAPDASPSLPGDLDDSSMPGPEEGFQDYLVRMQDLAGRELPEGAPPQQAERKFKQLFGGMPGLDIGGPPLPDRNEESALADDQAGLIDAVHGLAKADHAHRREVVLALTEHAHAIDDLTRHLERERVL